MPKKNLQIKFVSSINHRLLNALFDDIILVIIYNVQLIYNDQFSSSSSLLPGEISLL